MDSSRSLLVILSVFLVPFYLSYFHHVIFFMGKLCFLPSLPLSLLALSINEDLFYKFFLPSVFLTYLVYSTTGKHILSSHRKLFVNDW